MTTRGKIVVALLVLIGLYFGITKLLSSNLLFKKAETQSVVLSSIELPAATGTEGATMVVPLSALPTASPTDKGTPVTWEVMAWNAQMAGMLANGGPRSTQGSAMAANGLNLQIQCQDDTSKMQADLVKNAADLASNPKRPAW